MRRILLLFLLLAATGAVRAAESPTTHSPAARAGLPGMEGNETLVAPVTLDEHTLFRLRGVSALPASTRVAQVRQRIIAVAENPDLDPESRHIEKLPNEYLLLFGDQIILHLYPEDAAIERMPLDLLAPAILDRMADAVVEYREARSPRRLLIATGILAGITALAALLVYAAIRLFNWLGDLIERTVKQRFEHIERASHRVIDAAQLWDWLGGLVRGIRTVTVIAIVLTWLNTALGLYPWTRPFAANIFHLILSPLQRMGMGILNSLPDIFFLVVLFYVVRFLLNATRTFFERIDRGWFRLQNFDRDWAMPTYRIVRVLVIAFALVVAYPYIPGSDSDAFKGVSIFLGVIFSIGSSSFIANMIAGYSLTYRGAFREGDRVRIGEHTGEVVNVRALSTQLRSLKNEDINIPNSEVLSSTVLNYSTFAQQQGIILHTDVGIGYDAPWRQVEAMLLLAAQRTEGLEAEPPPFVLQTAMGDFTVIYQLNAFCRDAASMPGVYSRLHANIQDVFNEYGVQIMSPNYEADPEAPKVVPREQWFAAPAQGPAET